MVRRFLLYSLEHDRPVRAMLSETMSFRNIRVTALTPDRVTYRVAGRKTEITAPIESILSAGYARGDDGDTLQYASGVGGKADIVKEEKTDNGK